ncbi:MAG: alpha/beta fold hydrolase [Rhodospirillaceae bacterium]
MTTVGNRNLVDWDFSFPTGTTTIALSHARVFIAPRGRGPAALFIHGGFHGAWCWAPTMRVLAQHNFPTAAIDLRGHGGLPQDNAFTASGVHEMSQDVIEAVTAVGGDVMLIGHSLGALIAMAAAKLIRPRALVMLAPAPPANIPKLHILPPFPEDNPIAPPPEARARKWLLQGLPAKAEIAPYLARLCPESPVLLNDRYCQRVTVDPAWIQGPRLCVTGARDVSPLHVPAEDLAVADFFGAERAQVDGGHCFMVENGQAARQLLAWLSRHNLTGAV